jgi:hypothetical protein
MYAYLMHWLIQGAEQRWRREKKERAVVLPSAAGKNKVRCQRRVYRLMFFSQKSKSGKSQPTNEWDWEGQRLTILNAIRSFLALDLYRVIVASSERDTVIR